MKIVRAGIVAGAAIVLGLGCGKPAHAYGFWWGGNVTVTYSDPTGYSGWISGFEAQTDNMVERDAWEGTGTSSSTITCDYSVTYTPDAGAPAVCPCSGGQMLASAGAYAYIGYGADTSQGYGEAWVNPQIAGSNSAHTSSVADSGMVGTEVDTSSSDTSNHDWSMGDLTVATTVVVETKVKGQGALILSEYSTGGPYAGGYGSAWVRFPIPPQQQ